MTTIRKLCCNDLLGFTSVNLDHLTITTEMSLYLTWLAKWSDYCHVAVAPGNRIIGYILGAAEEQAQGAPWQGLVQAVNVASEYRRQKFATRLMRTFEKQLVEKMRVSPWYRRYFVCLYVGVNNTPAREMFEQLGYEIIRVMPNFLPNNENANGECLYKISVKTASEINAGTNSSIKLTLYDSSGGAMEITNLADWGVNGTSYDYFEKGNLDIFNGSAICVSPSSIVVTSDDSGRTRWKLDYVEVVTTGTEIPNTCSIFKVDQWLDTDTSTYSLSASSDPCDIVPEGAAGSDNLEVDDGVAGGCLYKISVKTASDINAGTNSSIKLTIYDSSGGAMEITNLADWGVNGTSYDYFEKGNLDIFNGSATCVSPSSIVVTSDDSTKWKLDYMEVATTGTEMPNTCSIFKVDQWLDTDKSPYSLSASSDPCDIVPVGAAGSDNREVDDVAAGDRCDYTISVQTANVDSAGTDSRISMTLGEEHGATIEIKNLADWGLSGPSYDYFEKGNLDIFSGRAACILPCSINVTSNYSGNKPGWKLGYVEVITAGPQIPPGSRSVFEVNQWLATDVPPHSLSASRDQCNGVRAGSADHEVNDNKRSGPAFDILRSLE